MSIALVSPPWPLANRPSTALGALKGYLAKYGVRLDTYHLHMVVAGRLTLSRYHEIAMQWAVAESLYAMLVAPDERDDIIGRVVKRLTAAGQAEIANWITPQFCYELARITEHSVAQIGLFRYNIVGLSVTHLQLMSSLYIAGIIKRMNPEVIVIFGGAGVSGEIGKNLLAQCRDIDLIVDGEGEEALLQLSRLSPPFTDENLGLVPNLWYRTSKGELKHTPSRTLSSLEDVPVPDFSDFFDLAYKLGFPLPRLVLPIEGSRGCAWEHRGPEGTLQGCAFCGLNRNWPNYREKTLEKLLREIDDGVARYHVLNLSFSDACLSESYRKELLRALIASKRDLTLFCEIRPGFDEETAQLLARAGTRTIQIGVESFSTSLLARLGKGVRAIDNVNTLKMCEEYRIPHEYNLLVELPGVTSQEMEETLAILPLLYGLRPPTPTQLFLSRGSRMYQSPEAFRIALEHLDNAGCDYVPHCLAHAKVTDQVPYYRASSPLVDDAWRMISEHVATWHQVRQRAELPLSYRDGGDFTVISDLRRVEPHSLVLEGTARDVFLACRRVISMGQLQQRLFNINVTELTQILDRLALEGLVLREGTHVLALPVRASSPSGDPRRPDLS